MDVNARQQETLLFVHVPKTGGTTLRCIVERQYMGQALYVIHHDINKDRGKLEALDEEAKRWFRAVFGHMCWGWHRYLAPGQPYAYVIMLRDPIERVLSLYAHCRLSEHYMGPHVGKMDLAQFVSSGVAAQAENGMVRQLCGRDAFKQKPWDDMQIPQGGITRADLETAKEHLRECAVVGVAEQFGAFIEAMNRRYAWRVHHWRNENVTRWPRLKRQSLDTGTLRAVEKATELDRELYDLAVELARGQG